MSRPACTAAALVLALALAPTAGKADAPATGAHPSQVRTAYAEGCDWARTGLADPNWKLFLQPVADACDAVRDGGYLAKGHTLTTTGPVAELAADFVVSVHRATRALDALYLQLWREGLALDEPGTGTVALNDTGVFLALRP